MFGLNIYLALNDADETRKIKQFLISRGFNVQEESGSGTQAIRRIRTLKPEVVIADSTLPGLSGMQIAEIAEQEDLCPVIVIKSSARNEFWTDDGEHGAVFMQRPISGSALLQTIQISVINFNKIRKLKREIRELKDSLTGRKQIEKAKGIVMKKYGLDEEEAYRRIRKQSMDRGIPLEEIAKAIILSEEI